MQIPAPTASGDQISLQALKDLTNVNQIAACQRLEFAAEGLTVIYGDNGSGKSGYTRVLKRACRARDQKEPIHPNAYLPAGKTGTATATFEVVINGTPQELSWTDSQPAPDALSSLAVFDSHCARSYLDQEGDFAYVPYGLDILTKLADACNQLKKKLDTEYAQFAVDTSSNATWTRALRALSASTISRATSRCAGASPGPSACLRSTAGTTAMRSPDSRSTGRGATP